MTFKTISLDKVVEFLRRDCGECSMFGFAGKPGAHHKVERREGGLILSCSFNDYKIRARLKPEVFSKDLEEMSKQLKELHREWPKKVEDSYKTNFFERVNELFGKLYIYAKIAPKNFKAVFEGVCLYCGQEAPITIKENKTFVGCFPCASIIADSAD